MNYDQFLENISADIKESLEPEFGPLHTEIKDVEKLSGRSYTGLMIRKEGSIHCRRARTYHGDPA